MRFECVGARAWLSMVHQALSCLLMHSLTSARLLACVRDIPDRYRLYLVDQFGVLHDGRRAFQGAVDAMRELKTRGATIIVLSNSGKRAASNVDRLQQMGFDGSCFDAVVSSGEVAWHVLAGTKGSDVSQQERLILSEEPRCLLVANDGDTSAVDGLPMTLVESIDEADVILLAGFHGDRSDVEALVARLHASVEQGVPCICTNPDKLAYTPEGPVFSAGTVADAYASAGGNVIWLGKPYAGIYAYAMKESGEPPPSQILCIGDSIEHDIAGGTTAGADTLLIKSGIYRHLDDAALQARCVEHQCVPTFVMSRFIGDCGS